MQYIDLLGSFQSSLNLDEFASTFFLVTNIPVYERRESSNYFNGYYFRGKYNNSLTFTVSLSDEKGNDDLPFWVNISAKADDLKELKIIVDDMVRNKAVPSGFHFAYMLNFGTFEEQRIDY
jgi:hypothetical protein